MFEQKWTAFFQPSNSALPLTEKVHCQLQSESKHYQQFLHLVKKRIKIDEAYLKELKSFACQIKAGRVDKPENQYCQKILQLISGSITSFQQVLAETWVKVISQLEDKNQALKRCMAGVRARMTSLESAVMASLASFKQVEDKFLKARRAFKEKYLHNLLAQKKEKPNSEKRLRTVRSLQLQKSKMEQMLTVTRAKQKQIIQKLRSSLNQISVIVDECEGTCVSGFSFRCSTSVILVEIEGLRKTKIEQLPGLNDALQSGLNQTQQFFLQVKKEVGERASRGVKLSNTILPFRPCTEQQRDRLQFSKAFRKAHEREEETIRNAITNQLEGPLVEEWKDKDTQMVRDAALVLFDLWFKRLGADKLNLHIALCRSQDYRDAFLYVFGLFRKCNKFLLRQESQEGLRVVLEEIVARCDQQEDLFFLRKVLILLLSYSFDKKVYAIELVKSCRVFEDEEFWVSSIFETVLEELVKRLECGRLGEEEVNALIVEHIRGFIPSMKELLRGKQAKAILEKVLRIMDLEEVSQKDFLLLTK